MMAQKIRIRASRGRIVVYNFDEKAFEKADMRVDCGDGVHVIENEIVGLWDCYGDILGDTCKHRGEVFLMWEVGFLDKEVEFVEAERR